MEFCCMQRNLILTKDGSHTIAIPSMNVTYHSMHGAIQESLHVFIEAGLKSMSPHSRLEARIFEMGFGTGLNALLTLAEADNMPWPVHYTAVELFPLEQGELQSLNYCEQLNRPELQPVFEDLHAAGWEKETQIKQNFTLLKLRSSLLNLPALPPFDLVYFDAFAPAAQPELWTPEVFRILYDLLLPGGILVTYCSKGDVRRAMQSAGFQVEKIPGPPGKREMVRARR